MYHHRVSRLWSYPLAFESVIDYSTLWSTNKSAFLACNRVCFALLFGSFVGTRTESSWHTLCISSSAIHSLRSWLGTLVPTLYPSGRLWQGLWGICEVRTLSIRPYEWCAGAISCIEKCTKCSWAGKMQPEVQKRTWWGFLILRHLLQRNNKYRKPGDDRALWNRADHVIGFLLRLHARIIADGQLFAGKVLPQNLRLS